MLLARQRVGIFPQEGCYFILTVYQTLNKREHKAPVSPQQPVLKRKCSLPEYSSPCSFWTEAAYHGHHPTGNATMNSSLKSAVPPHQIMSHFHSSYDSVDWKLCLSKGWMSCSSFSDPQEVSPRGQVGQCWRRLTRAGQGQVTLWCPDTSTR